MLSNTERLLFVLMSAIIGVITFVAFYRMYRVVRRGRPASELKNLPVQAARALLDIGLQIPIFKARPGLSIMHAFIFFGFSYYLLVNINDGLEGFIKGYSTAEISTFPVGILNLLADVLSVGVLVSMTFFLIRRFFGNDKRLEFNEGVLLNEHVAQGSIRRDSFIVGAWMIGHVGSRFLGQAFRLAEMGIENPMQPFATMISRAFIGMPPEALNTWIHIMWWMAVGLVVILMPYFAISKHFHLFGAPLNWILARQTPRGLLDPATPQSSNGSSESFEPGAGTIFDLPWPRVLDAYACIMCNRCQDVCPAHNTGQVLSPAAMEINKRYYFNDNFGDMAKSEFQPLPLLEMAISPEAVWACTTCYACVQVCPVGNEPMADIVDIRRRMILDSPGDLDSGIQSTLETIAKTGNSFGQSARKRGSWAKDLSFEVKDITKDPAEYLWFVGDYASFDSRVVPMTQLVASLFNEAGVDFGILYKGEKNAGNDVRRVGEEGLFEMLVEDNMAAIGETEFQKIMTTDPHTLNTLRNEYPKFGGMWPVEHYSSMLVDLIKAGRITLKNQLSQYHATYHDPCYLGRYNGGFAAPRSLLEMTGVAFTEMPRNRENSFCCGAGGGQIWKGATPDGERPAENRIREAIKTLSNVPGDKTLLFVVACPKDIVMYTDAVKSSGNEGKIEVRDIAQLVAEAAGHIMTTGTGEVEETEPA